MHVLYVLELASEQLALTSCKSSCNSGLQFRCAKIYRVYRTLLQLDLRGDFLQSRVLFAQNQSDRTD